MMGLIETYLRNILIVAVIGSLLELLVPNHENKKVVRLVVGLVLLLSMLHPLVGILKSGMQGAFSIPNGPVPQEWAGLMAEGESLLRYNQSGMLNQYQSALENQVSQNLSSLPGGKGAIVTVTVDQNPSSDTFGRVSSVTLRVKSPLTSIERTALVQQTATTLGIPLNNVTVFGG